MTPPLHRSLVFRRSTFCTAGTCVEVAVLTADGDVIVRDAKSQPDDAPVLRFRKDEWDAFVAGVHAGEFSYDALLAST